ncbi:NAD(P)-dependent oxidoreductase [Terrilactibacillus laevilacticus]|uniref:NAD(P)-dependent oxidoreductase n=1 Tax=Terrilactibacillus laevilacticus TaxID=1380157 RepID=A0ABW5PN38_9BACI|nr:NAD(P)-dependent oxidoreductase [Terrilactibacillus laevilacticus]
MSKPIIGFIGTGVMGQGMVRNLFKAGFNVNVYNRTKEKADELVKEGATWYGSPAEIAEASDIIITIVGYPKDVESVYLEDGILAHAKIGAYVIDMTTSSPQLAEKIHEEAEKRGIHALDAPVSGGDVGAKNGTLSIMVGGDKEDFEAVKSVFEAMGKNIVYQGKAGAGQHTKAANQIAIASGMLGVAEALAYAEHAGLDPETVLSSISQGAAGSWSLSNLGPRMLKGDFEPGFYVKHLIKDMKIALSSAESLNLDTPGLSLSEKLYEELAASGEENSGTQAIYKRYK